MALIALDTETELIATGLRAPPIVCVSFASHGTQPTTVKHVADPVTKKMVYYHLMINEIACHNLAFDMSVIMCQWPEFIPLVFKAYDENRLYCTEVRARLIDIAMGCHEKFYQSDGKNHKVKYQLNDLCIRFLEREIKGKGDIQLKFAEVKHLPISQWPEEYKHYSMADAVECLNLGTLQQDFAEYLYDEHRQTKAALGLYLTSAWGLNTNQQRVHALRDSIQSEYDEKAGQLISAGLMRWGGTKKKPKLVRCEDIARERYVACGGTKKTKGGAPSLTGEFLKDTGDPLLITYADVSSLTTQISTQIPALMLGTVEPLHTRFITIRTTGRTSSQNPNVQNQSRKGGFRECFEPRYGNHYYQADYSSFELFCLAQVCINILGGSRLGEMLNAGLDPHCEIAAKIMGCSYEEAVQLYKAGDEYADDCRQTGKIANFGLPGGLQAPALVEYAKSNYGVEITLEQAHMLKSIWEEAWPEIQLYFQYVKQQTGRRTGTIVHHYSQRVRGKCIFTQAANTYFQGLAADAAKAAYWLIVKACYLDTSSPLYGTRIVNFIHDEWIGEAPWSRAPEAAEELSRLMIVGAQPYLPDMHIKAEACVMKFWSKKAQTLRDGNGRLMAWPLAA